MDTPGHTAERRFSQARVVFGLVVMLVGTLLLLDRLDWWGVRLNVPIWPWVLVVLGLVRLSDGSTDARGCTRGRRSAAWLLLIGAWGLLNEYRIFGIHYGHSWPLLVIGAGAMVVWRSLDTTGAPLRREP
jgi:peptidoglycan/LPS O-acetylase OafA/YrhL